MNANCLSKYRGQIMGIATIMVALFHSSIVHANDGIDLFFFVGDMGVDIFFLVSGLGMFFAWSKKPTLKQFYKNRFLRIVPTWFLVNLIVQFETIICGQIDWWKEIKCFTGLSFILDGNLYFWYVPAILLLYLLTPAIMKQYEKNKKRAVVFCFLFLILALGICVIFRRMNYTIFLFRIPIFVLGILLGDCAYQQKRFPKKLPGVLLVVILFGLLGEYAIKHTFSIYRFVRYDFKYFIYFAVASAMCILLCYLFERYQVKMNFLKFVGSISLEVYLLHEFLLRVVTEKVGKVPFDAYGIIYNLLIFLVVIIISKVIHEIMGCFVRKVTKRGEK